MIVYNEMAENGTDLKFPWRRVGLWDQHNQSSGKRGQPCRRSSNVLVDLIQQKCAQLMLVLLQMQFSDVNIDLWFYYILGLLMVLAIYGKATLVLLCILLLLLLPLFFRRATPPAVFVTEPWMRCQNVWPNREWCAMTFISDRGYDVCPRGKIGAKKPHRLNIAKNFDAS